MDTLRRTTVTALAVGSVVLLAGCGSTAASSIGSPAANSAGQAATGGGAGAGNGSPQPSSASASASPGGAAPGQVASCRTSALTLRVDGAQAGAAAGSTFYPIDFTNTSPAACALKGFPGVSFVTGASHDGRQLGAAAQQNPAFDPVLVRIVPGGHAHAWLQVSAAGNYPGAACEPAAAGWLRVFPPGETVPGYVREQATACAAPAAQQLTIMPVRAGLGSHGSTP